MRTAKIIRLISFFIMLFWFWSITTKASEITASLSYSLGANKHPGKGNYCKYTKTPGGFGGAIGWENNDVFIGLTTILSRKTSCSLENTFLNIRRNWTQYGDGSFIKGGAGFFVAAKRNWRIESRMGGLMTLEAGGGGSDFVFTRMDVYNPFLHHHWQTLVHAGVGTRDTPSVKSYSQLTQIPGPQGPPGRDGIDGRNGQDGKGDEHEKDEH